MKLSQFSPQSIDYELDLNYYHGKDLIHQGHSISLNPKIAWKYISKEIRREIRLAQKTPGISIVRKPGTPKNLQLMKSVGFSSVDPSLPQSLAPAEFLYLAYYEAPPSLRSRSLAKGDKTKLVGGMILTPTSPTQLFLHFHTSSDLGKTLHVPSLLIWHAISDLKQSRFKYLDIGVSFRQNLNHYFKQWNQFRYPIIFEPPFILPDIRLTSFSARNLLAYQQKEVPKVDFAKYFGKEYCLLPRAITAIKVLIQHLGLKETDEVAIIKTRQNTFISRCVTDTISSVCRWSQKLSPKTKLVMVIHEFGYPYEGLSSMIRTCRKRKIPVVENCAWGIGSKTQDGQEIGRVGDYAIYSLPKIFPMQFGAVLTGLTISDPDLWSKFKVLDYYKTKLIIQGLAKYLPQISQINHRKQSNWNYLARKFKRDGFDPLINLATNYYPSAFLLKLQDSQQMRKLYQRYAKFGVEVGRYYQENTLYLPIHSKLSSVELDYIYAIFRGYLNLCSNYHRH